MQYNVTLVLGAGASIAMGYPVGATLRNSIIKDSVEKYSAYICSEELGIDENSIKNFVQIFNESQSSSIDAFLAKRQEFSNIGKRAISAILLDKENKDLLINNNHSDHWYKYFLNEIVVPHDWDSLPFKNMAIITFNYDRSFEHYLINSLMNLYNRSFDESYRKIHEMEIIHVYGMLGSDNISDMNYFPYGDNISEKNVSISASQLRVIPEGRNNDETLKSAQNILSNSLNIAFLGFGFDKINLERIDSAKTCGQIISIDSHEVERKIIATCYNMTRKESIRAARATINPNIEEYSTILFNDFKDDTCLNQLRNTLILEMINND